MNAGDVFRFPHIADRHVWMIISDPTKNPAKLLMVNFSSWEPHLDQACVMEAGEHPFIVHKTVINFARARIVSLEQMQTLRRRGQIEMLEPLTPTLLAKIRRATLESTRISLEMADILLDQDLVE